jgi:hypothetical protein
MSANNEVLKKMISACDPTELRALLNDLGYPRQPITPSLLERVHREQEEEFTPAFAKLVKQGIVSKRLNKATGDNYDPSTPDSNGTNDYTTSGYNDSWLFDYLGIDTGNSTPSTGSNGGGLDYYKIASSAGDFLGKVLPFLNINHSADANAMAQIAATQRAQINAQNNTVNNPLPWIIGGVVVIAIIIAIVTTKK